MGGIHNIIRRLSHQTSLDSITRAYIGGMGSKPTAAHTALIDVFVKNNKNIIQKADVLYLCNINGTNDSFRNLAKDAHHGTMQGSGLVFDPYWGFSNPDGTGYVDTNYNPATQGVNYQLNDAGLIIYCIENNTAPTGYYIGSITPGSVNTSLRKGTLTTLNSYINSAQVLDTSSIPFQNGLFGGVRTSATEVKNNNQNILTTPTAKVSNAIPSVNIYFFGRNSGNNLADAYRGGLSFIYIGASLTDAEFTQLNNAVNDYLIQCLFLKYGADNWGVKMAKSYFLELHNFDKYEAWEVYEFIKRHQEDYMNVQPNVETLSNSGATGMTDWVDSDSDGFADGWSDYDNVGYQSTGLVVTGNGFANNAQRVEKSTGLRISLRYFNSTYRVGSVYVVRFKYRASQGFRMGVGGYGVIDADTGMGIIVPPNTGNAVEYSRRITPPTQSGNFWFFADQASSTGDYIELDEVSIQEVPEQGYYYNTFGPNGQNKTVADYIMLFKAGGNLVANSWTKTGATLRWNQDGTITSSNTMPTYTRGTNLGIVTVTSTDGWDGVSVINLYQTFNSVNSFYGNFPLLEKIKTSGNYQLTAYQNRWKFKLTSPHNLLTRFLIYNSTYPCFIKYNLNNIISNVIDNLRTYANVDMVIEGNFTLITNQITSQLTIDGVLTQRFDGLVGTLQNMAIPDTMQFIYVARSGIVAGTSTWNKNCAQLTLSDCRLPTSAVDAQLKVVNDYFSINTPIKNLTINLSGATMGFPSGGVNNPDLLGIIAKHVAAGFTATITVRTS